MARRWTAGSSATISGLEFRVVDGNKEPGDLRVEWRTATGWQPVEMAAAFYLVDFFVDNEDHLKQFRPHWTETAADFFFGHLWMAVKKGWTEARDTVVRDRQRREEAA